MSRNIHTSNDFDSSTYGVGGGEGDETRSRGTSSTDEDLVVHEGSQESLRRGGRDGSFGEVP